MVRSVQERVYSHVQEKEGRMSTGLELIGHFAVVAGVGVGMFAIYIGASVAVEWLALRGEKKRKAIHAERRSHDYRPKA